ncbi:MAG TPA: type II secretion system F family protein [Allosphingosinicella sp.]|jgi:type II secretory pathway component PulF
MTLYRCLVVSADGASAWREVDAVGEAAAAAHFSAAGFVPIEVRSGRMGLSERLNRPVRVGGGLGLGEQALVLTQLALLIRSGLPVDRSLDLLREQAPRAGQRELLNEALGRVRAGGSLASALEARKAFPAYVVGVIRSAERSGRLGDALGSLAGRMTLAAATRRQLITALTYPAAILVATFLALFLVLTQVVPQFEPVFAGGGDRLPQLTRLVLSLSAAVTGHGFALLLLTAGPILLIWLLLRSPGGKALIARHRRRIPGAGLRDQHLAGQLLGLIATLLSNGVPVVGALPLARGAIGSETWRTHLAEAERRVREGASLSRALSAADLVPRTAIRLIEVGERSGRLAETCEQASLVLGTAARARIERIVTLVNPIAIVSLGGLVAMLVGGVMLGIFAMGDFAG